MVLGFVSAAKHALLSAGEKTKQLTDTIKWKNLSE